MKSNKYYKGEKANPFEEVNEKQGGHAMRYNQLASLLWFFEYYWQHGWKGLSKLDDAPTLVFFEIVPEPQKQYSNFEDALAEFGSWKSTGWLYGCRDWVFYVYENAYKERFYNPITQILPPKELPTFLLYWDGTTYNRWEATQTTKSNARSFWWNFESSWYRLTPNGQHTEAGWQQYLQEYLMRNSHNINPSSKEYQQELQELLKRYRSWK